MPWECNECGVPIREAILCPGCRALAFCSQAHCIAGARKHASDECYRMQRQLLRADMLLSDCSGKPHQGDSTDAAVCKQLAARGIHKVHPFSRLCDCQGEVAASEAGQGSELYRI